MARLIRLLLALSLTFAHPPAAAFFGTPLEDAVAPLAEAIVPHGRAAVVPFQDAGNGDLSALGDLWRGRVEQGLASRGVALVTRQDLVAVIDDLHAFAAPGAEDALWGKAGARVVTAGTSYSPSGEGRSCTSRRSAATTARCCGP